MDLEGEFKRLTGSVSYFMHLSHEFYQVRNVSIPQASENFYITDGLDKPICKVLI